MDIYQAARRRGRRGKCLPLLPTLRWIWIILVNETLEINILKPRPCRGTERSNSTINDNLVPRPHQKEINMGNNIAVPTPSPYWVDARNKQNADYKWRNMGGREDRAPRVAASLEELISGVTQNGPEEGYLPGRSIGRMVRWHRPGEIRTYLLRVTNIG